ncbi:MAG: response regulator, partial [Nitrospirota bacterium]
MAGEQILIVDDEPHIQRLCAEILQAKGYHVKTTAWAREALELVKTIQIDLLVTDLLMPEMDGLQLIWESREYQRELPAIVMTGHGTMERAVECLKLGVQGFVVKPFTQTDIVVAVEEALAKHRLLQENMRYRLLMPLFEISRQLLSELNMGRLIEELVRIAVTETHSDGARFIQRDGSSASFVVKSDEGVAQATPAAITEYLLRGLAAPANGDLLML